ncbi:MAG: hypothetical protein Q9211_000395 [Gyalolechia sp. 1 TL-2023]
MSQNRAKAIYRVSLSVSQPAKDRQQSNIENRSFSPYKAPKQKEKEKQILKGMQESENVQERLDAQLGVAPNQETTDQGIKDVSMDGGVVNEESQFHDHKDEIGTRKIKREHQEEAFAHNTRAYEDEADADNFETNDDDYVSTADENQPISDNSKRIYDPNHGQNSDRYTGELDDSPEGLMSAVQKQHHVVMGGTVLAYRRMGRGNYQCLTIHPDAWPAKNNPPQVYWGIEWMDHKVTFETRTSMRRLFPSDDKEGRMGGDLVIVTRAKEQERRWIGTYSGIKRFYEEYPLNLLSSKQREARPRNLPKLTDDQAALKLQAADLADLLQRQKDPREATAEQPLAVTSIPAVSQSYMVPAQKATEKGSTGQTSPRKALAGQKQTAQRAKMAQPKPNLTLGPSGKKVLPGNSGGPQPTPEAQKAQKAQMAQMAQLTKMFNKPQPELTLGPSGEKVLPGNNGGPQPTPEAQMAS